MCLVLYLGSDKQRPLIGWDAAVPRFHVKDADTDAKKVSTHFRKRRAYYVGSDNGCGCGFRQEHEEMNDDAEQLASKTDNQKLLHEYVNKCLCDENSIELYSCWSGDEDLPMEFDRTIGVDELIDDGFWFAERQRTIVVRSSDHEL